MGSGRKKEPYLSCLSLFLLFVFICIFDGFCLLGVFAFSLFFVVLFWFVLFFGWLVGLFCIVLRFRLAPHTGPPLVWTVSALPLILDHHLFGPFPPSPHTGLPLVWTVSALPLILDHHLFGPFPPCPSYWTTTCLDRFRINNRPPLLVAHNTHMLRFCCCFFVFVFFFRTSQHRTKTKQQLYAGAPLSTCSPPPPGPPLPLIPSPSPLPPPSRFCPNPSDRLPFKPSVLLSRASHPVLSTSARTPRPSSNFISRRPQMEGRSVQQQRLAAQSSPQFIAVRFFLGFALR